MLFIFLQLEFFFSSRKAALTSLALPLIFFGLHNSGYGTTTLWSHNSFNFPFGTLLLAVLASLLLNNKSIPSQTILLFGFAEGILSAVQLYFIVWPICSVITIFVFYRLKGSGYGESLKASFLLGLGGILGFFTAILPIINKLPRLEYWVTNLIFHQGTYGSGPTGIISGQAFSANSKQIIFSQPELFIIAVILIAVFIIILATKIELITAYPGPFSMGIGLIFQFLALSLLIIKHPGNLYLLSVATTIPLLAFIDLKLLEIWADDQKWRMNESVYAIFLIGLVIFICSESIVNLKTAIDTHKANVIFMNDIDNSVEDVLTQYAERTGQRKRDLKVLYTYGTYNGCYALLAGKNYVQLPIEKKIAKICPNSYELSIWNQKVLTSVRDRRHTLDEVNWDFILIQKTVLREKFNSLLENEIVIQISSKYPEFVIIQNHIKK
jgi:hypothetical protein